MITSEADLMSTSDATRVNMQQVIHNLPLTSPVKRASYHHKRCQPTKDVSPPFDRGYIIFGIYRTLIIQLYFVTIQSFSYGQSSTLVLDRLWQVQLSAPRGCISRLNYTASRKFSSPATIHLQPNFHLI